MGSKERSVTKSVIIPRAVLLGESLLNGCCNNHDIPPSCGHLLPLSLPSWELQRTVMARVREKRATSFVQAGIAEKTGSSSSLTGMVFLPSHW